MNSSDEAAQDGMKSLLLRVVLEEASKDAINPRASVVLPFQGNNLLLVYFTVESPCTRLHHLYLVPG